MTANEIIKDIKARKFKKEFWTKDIRFASQEEITSLWLWVIGSIAPFGFENVEVSVYVDSEIFEHDYFMFNPADPCKSVRVKTIDFKNIYEKSMAPEGVLTIKNRSNMN